MSVRGCTGEPADLRTMVTVSASPHAARQPLFGSAGCAAAGTLRLREEPGGRSGPELLRVRERR